MPIIAMSSPKGGVGKTTLSAHVAAILASRGHRVLAIDLDPQNALRLHFGLSIKNEAGFMAEVARNQGSGWSRMLEQTPSGVRLLAHGAMDPFQVLSFTQKLLARPAMLADPVKEMASDPGLVVVVDCPPGPNAALSAIFPMVDLIVVVLLSDAGSAAVLPQVASGRFIGRGTMAAKAAARVGVVMNQVDLDQPLSAAVLDAAERSLGPQLLGAVCYDHALAEALANKRLLLDGQEGAGEDLQLLASAIAGRVPLQEPQAPPAPKPFAALSEWGVR